MTENSDENKAQDSYAGETLYIFSTGARSSGKVRPLTTYLINKIWGGALPHYQRIAEPRGIPEDSIPILFYLESRRGG